MAPTQQLGKYELINELGRGGFGVVYQARDTRLGRPVALKLLHAHLCTDPTFVSRFEREARTMAKLDHPSIVKIYEIDEVAGQWYLAMAYLAGQSLRQLLKTAGPLALEQAVPILGQLASALDYAHALV